jgi:NAD(P)-dependent dehydrogenase (short-subunit alcohol dehydrogenase family)
MARVLFPLWQVDEQEYRAMCAYLDVAPESRLYDRLSAYLASASFRFSRPKGFALFLARPRLTEFRIARLDLTTKLFLSGHPIRHMLNAVIALHECHDKSYRRMALAPTGWALALSMLRWGLGFGLSVAITIPWLAWELLVYSAGKPFRTEVDLAGKRILITGSSRGLGMDLMLQCLEQGAEVVGTVRNRDSLDSLKALLPGGAPITLLIADLSQPGALVHGLREAQIPAGSIDMAILCAGVKYTGSSVLSLDNLHDTFQVNFFSAVELAAWLSAPGSAKQQIASDQATLVLVSSIGRWHGMHMSSGYNASKAALSIWAESLEMEMLGHAHRRLAVMIVEPGMFESGMTHGAGLTKVLLVSRRDLAGRILSGALTGRRALRSPWWFALLTWGLCLGGRSLRSRLLTRVNKHQRP